MILNLAMGMAAKRHKRRKNKSNRPVQQLVLLHLARQAFAPRHHGKSVSVFEPFALFCGKSTAVFKMIACGKFGRDARTHTRDACAPQFHCGIMVQSRSENVMAGIFVCRPEKTSPGEQLDQSNDLPWGDTVPPGWKPGSTSGRMPDATSTPAQPERCGRNEQAGRGRA
jgi:hypothetical protein